MKNKILINADDFGYSAPRNRGIIQCFEKGLITSATLLVNGYEAYQAVQLAKQTGLPIGLHFNITEGTPISRPTTISTLVKKESFLTKPVFWEIACSKPQQFNQLHVERELEAQISKFKEFTGYLPEFVDSHNHAHVATENIVKAFCKICQKYAISRTRLPIQVRTGTASQNSFYDIVSECSISARASIESSFLEVPRFLGLHLMGQDLSVDRLEKTLEILGLNGCFGDFELMVHPGFKTLRKGGCTSDGGDFDDFSESGDRELEMENLVAINAYLRKL
jgi:predicted glycoside hydrolase/deacetylase ChbG (UPF0249 family)